MEKSTALTSIRPGGIAVVSCDRADDAEHQWFCWVIIMAGVWESVGFGFRLGASKDISSFEFYMPQEALIVLAPLCE